VKSDAWIAEIALAFDHEERVLARFVCDHIQFPPWRGRKFDLPLLLLGKLDLDGRSNPIAFPPGMELNFFGMVLGLDIRRPALKLPGVGRLGLASSV
jgi:hypothetical protein